MKTIKVRALVLKEYEVGEADKRLLLLCKDVGRIMVYARGARKSRSKFLAAAQIFTYSDFILAQGRGFYSLAQADVIENFYELRTDYDILCAAHFIAEVCDKTLLEKSNCDELLLLVLKSLSILTKKKFPPKQIISVFLFRFFNFYGLRPNTKINFSQEKFFWGKEGLLSEEKISSEKIQISKSAIDAADFILNSDLSKSFMFEAHDSVLDELHNAAMLIWERALLDFL